ncbi:MAG TPA: carboxypeptidase-like regulatory domain-containing protein [Conexivisphaerales archaeon]|nr:carboxypeptidase-like regulatory domain-containing protein [Conexivisphaerales archaeon]
MKYRPLYVLALAALVAQLFVAPVSPAFSASYNLSGATVSADPLSFGPTGSSGTADANGNYVINSNIGVGQYNVTASDTGFLDQAQTATINSTSDVDTLNFNLVRSGILWGRVLGFDGAPVVGAEVMLLDSSGGEASSTITDSNGMYYFYDRVGTDTYSVKVDFQFSFSLLAELLQFEGNATGLNFPYQDAPYLTNGYVGATSGTVSATTGAYTQVPDLVLQKSGVITGTVTDSQSHPMANVPVSVEGMSSSLSGIVLTDSSGNYRVSYDIVSDTYQVKAEAYGYVPASNTVAASQTGTVNLNLMIAKSAGLSGHVYRSSDMKPIPNALIVLQGKTTSMFGTASSDGNGFYDVFGSLGTDSYNLEVLVGSTPIYTGTVSLTSGQNATQDFTGNVFFVSGTVKANSTGGPGIFATVSGSMFPPVGFPFSGSSGSNGSFNFAVGVTTGAGGTPVTINLTASSFGYSSSSALVNATYGSDISQDFVLLPTSSSAASATIKGTVTGNSGPNLPATMYWWHSGSYLFGVNSTSDVPLLYLETNNTILIEASGPEGTQGTTTLWVPDSVGRSPFTVTSFPGPNPTIVSQQDNGTYSSVTFSYSHSDHAFSIIGSTPVPEFPGVALVAALGSAVAVSLLYERKLRVGSLSPAQ